MNPLSPGLPGYCSVGLPPSVTSSRPIAIIWVTIYGPLTKEKTEVKVTIAGIQQSHNSNPAPEQEAEVVLAGYLTGLQVCVSFRKPPAKSGGLGILPRPALPPTPLQGQGQAGGRWPHPSQSCTCPLDTSQSFLEKNRAPLAKILPGLVSGSSGDSWSASCSWQPPW